MADSEKKLRKEVLEVMHYFKHSGLVLCKDDKIEWEAMQRENGRNENKNDELDRLMKPYVSKETTNNLRNIICYLH